MIPQNILSQLPESERKTAKPSDAPIPAELTETYGRGITAVDCGTETRYYDSNGHLIKTVKNKV